jgi:hypothetical protein
MVDEIHGYVSIVYVLPNQKEANHADRFTANAIIFEFPKFFTSKHTAEYSIGGKAACSTSCT